MITTIIGREKEQKLLQKLYLSKQAEFLAVYGRRRIGKTYLVSEFYKNKGLYFELTGAKDTSKLEQLRHFAIEFGDRFCNGIQPSLPKSWTEAFDLLRRKTEEINDGRKIILFFDELPWLASRKSGFLEALDFCWNRYLSRNKNIILIVCGSAASWMIKKIINNKGGLHGRLSAQIKLLPFDLAETENFLKTRGVELERKQLIEIYMAIGGVAKYLTHIEKGKSSAQIIQDICFTQGGPLTYEFHKLYKSLFDNHLKHIHVVETLAKTRSGMTKIALLKATNMESGGTSSAILQELEESGFILYVSDFGKKKKQGKYRLVDEFSLFYLTWMKDALQLKTINKDYWLRVQNSPSFISWAGYTFEALCLKHLSKIIDALGLSVVANSASEWSYLPKQGIQEEGVQIDLVIDRADKCINLCEMKFYSDELITDKSYAAEWKKKKNLFRKITKTKKSLFTTLITVYGAKENTHYLSSVDNQLTIDEFFT